MKKIIYFDYAATTPVDLRAVEKMLCYLTQSGDFGNPSSAHHFGRQAKQAIDHARGQVAELIHADSSEIIWTSGATESNNLALRGIAQLYQRKGKHIITVKTEHSSVLESCQQLEKEGFSVTYLGVKKNGLIDLNQLEQAFRSDTILASIMHVNNEIGVIQDIPRIAQMTAARGVLLHVDAAQSADKIPIDLQSWPVDLMSLSAHKVYGPKGMGALYIRRKPRVRVAPQIFGGGQEMGMRAGTLSTHQVVGMGEAFSIAQQVMEADQQQIKKLRDDFWKKIRTMKNIILNTDFTCSVPNIINFGFKNKTAEQLMSAMPQIAISSGSACQSKGVEPSYILRALGLSHDEAQSAVRISFGRFTTQTEIDELVQQIKNAN